MILITGGSGFVGRALIPRLLAAGYRVRMLSARGKNPAEPWSSQVEMSEGNIHNIESLYRAMIGVHSVIHLASAQWWGRKRDLEQIDLQGTQNIITAGRSARIGRLLVMSHLGASPSSAFMLLRAKGQMEELVRSSGLAYTIFRSGIIFGQGDIFVNGIAQLLRANPLIFLQPGRGEGLLHPIYIDDLAEALVRSLEHLSTVDETIGVGGPEYMTFNEIVRTVMRVSRAKRLIVPIPPYSLRAISSIIGRFFPNFPMTPQWFDLIASNRTASMSTLYDLFEMQPRRFEDTIVTYMPKRRYGLELLRAMARRRPRGVA